MSGFTSSLPPYLVVNAGTTANPFSGLSYSDTVGYIETITVTLSFLPYENDYYGNTPSSFGSITDPLASGTFNADTDTFTATASVVGNPTAASQILDRLVYTPPALSNGVSPAFLASISVTSTDPTTGQLVNSSSAAEDLIVVTPPSISPTTSNQPVASGGTIDPFGGVYVTDINTSYLNTLNDAITITDGGVATDADGILTGAGLSKTGVGTYVLAGYNSENLSSLAFTASSFATTHTASFSLVASDTATGLSTTDNNTSVQIQGTGPAPTAPIVSGIISAQTVVLGNAIDPFNTVTISDNNPDPLDTVTITQSGGGTLSGLNMTSQGVYTIDAATPTAIASILQSASFSSDAAGKTTFSISATDGMLTSASVKPTSITVVKPSAPPPTNPPFTITDETTGKTTYTAGVPYSGPVAGIATQLIFQSSDSLNVTANTPNVFIHTGSGTDAINVSQSNGNNILDGSTGSNFLTGGTGNDTFFLDDRNPLSDIFSTVVGLHAGDSLTVFGITPTGFNVATLNNQGADNAKGLDYAITAPGHANANLVLAGFSTADIASGRITATYGTTPDTPGLPGSPYLNLFINS